LDFSFIFLIFLAYRHDQLETARRENVFLTMRLADIEHNRQNAENASRMATPRGRTHPKVEEALWSLWMSVPIRYTDNVSCINKLWEVGCEYYQKKGVMPPGDLRRQVNLDSIHNSCCFS
jgi:hypothetical protein